MRHIAKVICTLIVAALLAAGPALAGDWPVYRHDNNRSSATAERLAVKKLKPVWTYRSPIPPQPAWDGPARWDAYHGIHSLPARRDYDVVFAPIIVGRSLYFGSSADDSVHCIDTRTGEEKWTFTTGGPVRIAPTHYKGKLYFGSDDGLAYCITADTGKRVWSYSPAPQQRLVLQDGRFISARACRTGITIYEDENGRATAYFAVSFLPWVSPYICALDPETGEPEGEGRYARRFDHPFPIEGAMLATKTHLYAPRGNKPSELFRRTDGTPLGGIWASSGGIFCLHIPEENRIVACGLAYKGAAALLDTPLDGLGDSKRIRYIRGARGMAYKSGVSYTRNQGNVYATERKTNRKLWDVGGGAMFDVIVAGNAVFIGAEDKVRAVSASTGKPAWEARVLGQAHALAVADRALFVSTDRGTITCFRPATTAPRRKKAAKKKSKTTRDAAKVTAGPFVRYLDANSAEISWHTARLTPTILVYGDGAKTFRDAKPKIVHRAVMKDISLDRAYKYQIRTFVRGVWRQTGNYAIDTHFNFHLPSIPEQADPYAKDEMAGAYAKVAAYAVKTAKADQGLCLVIGAGDLGHLGYRIAKATRMRVLYVDADLKQVEAARAKLFATGAYGARVAVLHVENTTNLPLPGGVFHLIVGNSPMTAGKWTGDIDEVARLLKPVQGVALFGRPAGVEETALGLRGPVFKWDVTMTDDGIWGRLARTKPTAGSKPWTHMYGGAHNTACSDDTLQGAASFEQFVTQWLGRPGARYQADRQNRKPAPLAANGRLFMQGLGTLISVDAYDGTVLWSLEIPGLAHFNMTRDSSNFCTDGDYVYLAFRDKCWMIEADTGKVHKMLDVVPKPRRKQAPRWGYVASVEDTLIGSTAQMGAEWSGYWGSGAWYEHGGWEKICSDQLFGIDKKTGSIKWTYTKGVIIHTTITIGNKRIYFCESRDKRAIDSGSRALNGGEIWDEQYLVALDVNTGKKLWEEKFQRGRIVAGNAMYSLAYAGEKLVLSSASGGKGGGNHFIYAFDAASGKEAWKAQMRWPGYGHGVHLGRPVVVGDTLYISPGVFELETGKRLPIKAPKGACGTESASRHALFSRASTIGIWDRKTHKQTVVPTVRPDCWLTAIPAEGLLLAPEGGGGCVCSFWLESSIALAPRTDTTRFVAHELDRILDIALAPRTDTTRFKTKKTEFLGTMTVELLTPVAPGVVRYTTDGTDPAATSPAYAGPITVDKTCEVRARVVGAAIGPKLGPVISRRFERLEPKLPAEGRVNFQHPVTPKPVGWMADVGNAVSIQDGGCAYGWNKLQAGWPNDPKQVKDPVKGTCNWVNQHVRWEMAVENGDYEVTVCIGHPQGDTKIQHAGILLVNETEFKLAKDLAKSELITLTLKVKVTDGKLVMHRKDKKSVGVEYLKFRRL